LSVNEARGIAQNISARDAHRGAAEQLDGAVFEAAAAHLRTAAITEDRYVTAHLSGYVPDPGKGLPMRRVVAVRHIEPKDVDALVDQRLQQIRGLRSGTDGRDDLGATVALQVDLGNNARWMLAQRLIGGLI
jgi:hypothetical protein